MIDVLFVCTGNTCRSPMAACLFNARCAALGLPYHAESAGLMAAPGLPASDGAWQAMRERGLSLERHAARPLTDALVRDAKRIVCMSPSHAQAVLQRYPDARVTSFQPPIADPYAGSLAVYRACADQLAVQLEALLADCAR